MQNAIITGLGIAFVGLMGPIMVLANAPEPKIGAPILVLSWNAQEQVVAAGGQLIGPQNAPLAVLATGGGTFMKNLDQSDVWLVTDGTWVAEICGVQSI